MAIVLGQDLCTVLIHYVAYNHTHLLGLKLAEGKEEDTADIVLFTSMENVAGEKNFGQQFHQKVQYSQEGTPGTWHYLEETTGTKGIH